MDINKSEINRIIQDKMNNIDKIAEKKEKQTIFGISSRRIFGYIVVYSFLGYVIEVLYGLITKGVIECRQSFIYGPFCAIYGVGAILMLLILKKINTKSRIINFIVSGLIGCSIEYLVSWFGETFMHVKWWDYSNYFLNVNGRICLYFSLFWGTLGLFLIELLNPRVDLLMDRINGKYSRRLQNTLVVLANVFLVVDCALTIIAIDLFQTRVIHDNNIDVRYSEYYEQHYEDIYGSEKARNRIELTWGNDFMIKTFPNLKISTIDGESVYISSYYPEIQNYYFRVFDINNYNIVGKD